MIEKNKELLEAEKKRIESLLAKVAKPDAKKVDEFEAKYPNLGDSEDDNAHEVAEFQTNISEEASLTDSLEKIKAALVRIKENTYGVCVVGGEQIDGKRLEAVPEADTCVEHSK